MRNSLRQLLSPLRKALGQFVITSESNSSNDYIAPRESIIYKAAEFAAVNKVQGDYLEFGVFRGGSYISAYHTLRYCFVDVIDRFGFTMSETEKHETISILEQMRFFAFDSFAGLPSVANTEAFGFFKEGQFMAGLTEFKANVALGKVPFERSVIVPGWYSDSLTSATCHEHGLAKAAVVHIDCDLYESTRLVLKFVTPLLVDGTVLIFDDWFHFNGHPLRGEQRAFNEWAKTLENWSFSEFQQEGTWRKSFIASKH